MEASLPGIIIHARDTTVNNRLRPQRVKSSWKAQANRYTSAHIIYQVTGARKGSNKRLLCRNKDLVLVRFPVYSVHLDSSGQWTVGKGVRCHFQGRLSRAVCASNFLSLARQTKKPHEDGMVIFSGRDGRELGTLVNWMKDWISYELEINVELSHWDLGVHYCSMA